jgi:hypothetical protein
VSKLQRHRCPTFGALRPRNRRGQTGRYIFIYIDNEATGCEFMDCIHSACNSIQWWGLSDLVQNLRAA